MEPFEIRWRSSTRKDFRGLPQLDVSRILQADEALANEPLPHGSQKLTNSDRTYRIRVGDYRVVYEVYSAEKIVEIQRVRHRKDVYRS